MISHEQPATQPTRFGGFFNLRANMKPTRSPGADHAGSIFRVYMGGNAIVTWYVAMTDARSLIHHVAATGEGAALIWMLMLVGAAAVIDAVVNDLLPPRFHWRVALRLRGPCREGEKAAKDGPAVVHVRAPINSA